MSLGVLPKCNLLMLPPTGIIPFASCLFICFAGLDTTNKSCTAICAVHESNTLVLVAINVIN